MNKESLNQVLASSLKGELFVTVDGETTLKAAVEKMRDQRCNVAAVIQEGTLVGVIDSNTVTQTILDSPEAGDSWSRTCSVCCNKVQHVAPNQSVSDVAKQLGQAPWIAVIEGNHISSLVSRAALVRSLNSLLNTQIHAYSPHCDSRAPQLAIKA